jgi:hypothetical protein
MPKQFAGAPEAPAFVSLGICSILFCVASIADLPLPIIFVLLMLALHIGLVALYSREPHLSTLMNTFYATRRRVDAIGPTHLPEYNP